MRTTDEELVERELEIAALKDLFEGFPRAAKRLALIEAPAGLGKTALLRHAGNEALRRGLRVMSARGSELERDYPFALVGQLLAPVLATARGYDRTVLLRGAAALALPVLEGALDGVGSEEPARARGEHRGSLPLAPEPVSAPGADPGYAALHGLYWLLSNSAEIQPALLSVDDLHWADAASLRFLAFLEARLEGMPVLVVCARRPREPGTEEALLGRVGVGPLAVRVQPGPLSEAGTARLLERAFERSPEAAFASACHVACAGNPFYLEVLASELRQSGAEPDEAHAARVERLAPSAIARTVLLRLSRLEAGATDLVKAVAVLGDDARLEVAAAIAGLALDEARTTTAELQRVSVLRPTERLGFVHPIVRATIYDELSAHERSEAHRRAAQQLRLAGSAPEQVAGHLLRAPPLGDAEAVELLREASRRVIERGAPEGAVAYLTRALAEPPSADAEAAVLAELGSAEARVAAPAAIEHLRGAREREADPVRRGRVSLELGRVLLIGGALSAAVEVLEAAAGEIREVAPELSARLALEAVGARRVVPGGSRPAGLDDLEASLARGSPVKSLALWARAMDASLAGDPTGDLAELALSDGKLRREEGTASQAFVTLVNILTFSDRFERSREVIEDALDAARREGSVASFATMSGCRAALHRRMGKLADAEADARAALGAAELGGMQILEPMWLAELVETEIDLGATAKVEEDLAERGVAAKLTSPDLGTMFLLCARARLRAASGDLACALADFEAAGAGLDLLQVVNPAVVPWRSSAARVRLAQGDREHARALAEEEVDLARRCQVPTALSRALRVRGLVREGPGAMVDLREALDVLDGSPPTLARAHALVDFGAALRRTGRRADARGPLREGHELAERFGARPLADRARTELEAAGARPRHPVRTGLDALTPSERRIVDMAAGGLSNAEIAQALFVTVRTVETHLTHAYEKLEVSGRGQLVGALEGEEGG